MESFLNFYKKGLEHILNINRQGYHLVEVYTKLLLTYSDHYTYCERRFEQPENG